MPIIKAEPLRELTRACFLAAGCPEEEAGQMAKLMVLANLRGHDSHGVRQLPRYLGNIREGKTVAGAKVSVVTETPSMAILDANRALGHIAATHAARVAIAKARECNISAVAVRNLDHIGRVGAYPEMAAEAGMIGLCFTAALGPSTIVTPYGGILGRYSTNPISVGFPSPAGDPILLDFATSVVAANKIRQALDRGQQAGEGWIVDRQGDATRDPQTFIDRNAALLPLGGAYGYKGYGLAVMVEILAGILTGSGTFATNEDKTKTNNVSFLIVINPLTFVSKEFYDREIAALVKYLHDTPVRPGDPPVMIPGEYEARSQQQRETAGIEIEAPVWQAIQEAAKALDVAVPATPPAAVPLP